MEAMESKKAQEEAKKREEEAKGFVKNDSCFVPVGDFDGDQAKFDEYAEEEVNIPNNAKPTNSPSTNKKK